MKPGELRRFKKDAFSETSSFKRYSGETFIILARRPTRYGLPAQYDFDILVCGEMSADWSDKAIADFSEVVNAAG
jgi:hypothetical protein